MANSPTLDKVCFVLSPIGREGTEQFERFKEVLDFVIRPAVEQSSKAMRLVRADDIERAGSFIKDILEYVAGAEVVIADLTGQNPNVFYELGVRHALSPRTILIAQGLDDIPSDLREYRTIIYETTAKGAALFRGRLEKYLADIAAQRERPDNPVLDRLGAVTGARTIELEAEVVELRKQLETVLRKGRTSRQDKVVSKEVVGEHLYLRLARVLQLRNIKREHFGQFPRMRADGTHEPAYAPTSQGDFALHFGRTTGGNTVFYYIAEAFGEDINKLIADMRVLLHATEKARLRAVTLVISSPQMPNDKKEWLRSAFQHILTFLPTGASTRYSLEFWDSEYVADAETELGLRYTPAK